MTIRLLRRLLSLCILSATAMACAFSSIAAETAATPPPATAQPTTPAAVVEQLHAALLDSMRGGATLGQTGRAALLAPVISGLFDFPTIARIVTGSAWQAASETQREAFIDVFRRLSIATYASNFSDHEGERFTTGETRESRGARIVQTQIVKADRETVPLDYMLHERDGNWRIVNVIAEGVSDLSLKRAEYTAVIQQDGLDALITRLEEKVAEFAR